MRCNDRKISEYKESDTNYEKSDTPPPPPIISRPLIPILQPTITKYHLHKRKKCRSCYKRENLQ
eukprot:UN17761